MNGNHLQNNSFSGLCRFSQHETEDRRSLKTHSLVCFPTCPSDSPVALSTGLRLTVGNLITWPKWQYLKCLSQLARLQFIGLLLYSIAMYMKITKLCFQRCEEHYANVTDGSVNWKISSSKRSSGSSSSPSAKNVGNGGFLLQSL